MIVTIIALVVTFGLLIFVHELGHFFMAKRTGMKVEEFGFGYPPRFLGIQKIYYKNGSKKWIFFFLKKKVYPDEQNITKKSTIYSLNFIPFGGFVKIKGEQGDNKNDSDSFSSKPIWKRALVLSSGVAMNVVLAFVLISIGFMIGLPSVVDKDLPSQAKVHERFIQVLQVQDGSPAAVAEIQVGDIIQSVDGKNIASVDDFQTYVKPKINEPIDITLQQEGETVTKSLTPQDLNNEGKGLIGVWLADTGLVSYPWYHAIWMGAKTTFQLTIRIIVAFYDLFKNLIISQQVQADIAGPVGIAVLTGQMAKMGFIYLLQFVAIFSINLAILNYIPFPALDGGRVLFLIIEKIKGKPINQKVEALVNNVGFMILIGLVLFITFKDISRFSDNIKGFLGNIF